MSDCAAERVRRLAVVHADRSSVLSLSLTGLGGNVVEEPGRDEWFWEDPDTSKITPDRSISFALALGSNRLDDLSSEVDPETWTAD